MACTNMGANVDYSVEIEKFLRNEYLLRYLTFKMFFVMYIKNYIFAMGKSP